MDETYRSSDKAKEETWNILGFERENIFHEQEHGWPPRNYTCSFCRRQFRSAQGLGGHMNVHRRERARLRNHSSPPDSWNVIDSSNPNPDLDDHKPDLNSNPTPLPLSPEADQCGASITLASSHQDVRTAAPAANFSAGSSSHHLAKDGDGDVLVANKKNKKSHLSDFGWKSTSFAEEGDGGGFEEIIENGKVVLVDGLDSEMGLVVRGGPSTSTAIKDLDLELRLGYP